MNNSVRLGVEAVLVIVLIIALFLYFSQQQQLTDTQAILDNANATVTAQAADLTGIEATVASAQAAAEEQGYAAATAIADVSGVQTQVGEVQAAADAAVAAQASAEAAALEQANIAATAVAEAESQAGVAATAGVQIEEAQAAADAAATAQANAEAAAQAVAQQVTDLQATIDAMSAGAAATSEPEATEAAEATEEVEATEAAPVVGFSYDTFSMALDASYTTYDLTGDNRETSLTAISAADAELGTRLSRESAHDYAASQATGEYVLVNQQGLPNGVDSVEDVAGVSFRRADSSEVVTLGENQVARGWFGENEVRYLVIDGGSMWIITFHSANAADNLAAFDAAVATFNAPEPPAESE